MSLFLEVHNGGKLLHRESAWCSQPLRKHPEEVRVQQVQVQGPIGPTAQASHIRAAEGPFGEKVTPILNVRKRTCGPILPRHPMGRKGHFQGQGSCLFRVHKAQGASVHCPAACGVVAEGAVEAEEVAAQGGRLGDDLEKRLLLEVEQVQGSLHLQEAAVRPPQMAWPDPSRLVDAQLTDVVSPGEGMPQRWKHHCVATVGAGDGLGVGQREAAASSQQLSCLRDFTVRFILPASVAAMVFQSQSGNLEGGGEKLQ